MSKHSLDVRIEWDNGISAPHPIDVAEKLREQFGKRFTVTELPRVEGKVDVEARAREKWKGINEYQVTRWEIFEFLRDCIQPLIDRLTAERDEAKADSDLAFSYGRDTGLQEAAHPVSWDAAMAAIMRATRAVPEWYEETGTKILLALGWTKPGERRKHELVLPLRA